jgi:type IV secretion system protein VirB4
MQFLPPLTCDPKVVARETPAGQHLPYARHIDDVTIETRDGLLMQTIRVEGLLFETADSDELNYRSGLRDAMLRSLGSSRFAVYHHVVRRKAEASLSRVTADDFSARLDERWQERLGAKQLFVNELFITIVRRPLQGRVGLADRIRGWAGRTSARSRRHLAAEKHALDRARETLMASFGAYAPRLLSIYETQHGPRSEPLEFLSCLYNADMRPVALPNGDLGHFIPARRVSFGQDCVELGPTGQLARRFVALVSIKDYPGATFPGMFDELYRLPFELHVTQSFAMVERGAALAQMNLALAHAIGGRRGRLAAR